MVGRFHASISESGGAQEKSRLKNHSSVLADETPLRKSLRAKLSPSASGPGRVKNVAGALAVLPSAVIAGQSKKRFIHGEHRGQCTLLPESLDDYVAAPNPVRIVDVFVDELDLGRMGFGHVIPAKTGRPAYHPAVLLKIYIYGYLNRIQSSRRLEREAQSNVELMWLTGRLMPDVKTIANFRKDNGKAIRVVCRQLRKA